MAISSINIQTSTAHSFKHNDRTDTPNYLIDSPSLNECNKTHEEAQALLESYIKEAEQYRKNYGLRAMKSNTIKSVEAVVNLNASHTLQDVEKLAKTIEKEFGFRAVQIAIHRDEGKDIKNKNYHAHIVMCNLTPEGKTIQRTLGKDGLKKLQDITASTLFMPRGKEGSQAERLDHKQYKSIAQEREQHQERITELNYNFRVYQKRITELETENIELKKELHRLNTQVNKNNASVEELEERLKSAKKPSSDISSFEEAQIKRREEMRRLLNDEEEKDDPRVEKLNKIDFRAVSSVLKATFERPEYFSRTEDSRSNEQIAIKTYQNSFLEVEKKSFFTTTITQELDENRLIKGLFKN